MKNIYLCGHTGSMNRGCEAIVVSISYILDKIGVSKKHRFLFTYDSKYDKMLHLDNEINLISYPKRTFFDRMRNFLFRKTGVDDIRINKRYFKNSFKFLNKNDIAFTIGGDTYCYSTPILTYSSNIVLHKKNIPNVFYGCSINESTINNKDMCKDINQFNYIITREIYSKNNFEHILNNSNKLYYACDPAFNLPIKKTKLPNGFIENNTVGINLSPLVFNDYKNPNDIIYKNIYNLIDYIINETKMNVCLIPHVYNIEKNLQDSYVLNLIYEKYKNNKRISIVNTELSCTELKFIISKCRFFIGARTHATIAAYSTSVPTLVLSYSIKSRGIANDLFGKEDGFLLKWEKIKKDDEIKNCFVSSIINNETDILNTYSNILPKYKKTIIEVTRKVLEDLDYEN